jgi:hypothetical protein
VVRISPERQAAKTLHTASGGKSLPGPA